jgi:hypothetical protein
MKVAIFAPYGEQPKETGLLYLVANYLVKSGAGIHQMLCDGAVPICGRSRITGEVAGPFQCARCIGEQGRLVSWAGLSCRGISREIIPDDVRTAMQWITNVPVQDLGRVEFRGVNLWSACKAELSARFEGKDLEALSESDEVDVRAMFIAYTRVAVASERFIKQIKPDLALVSSIRDPLCHAFVLQANQAKLDTAVFSYDSRSAVVSIESLATRKSYTTSLVLDKVASMRGEPRTWGAEITSVVHEALTFLGYAPDRDLISPVHQTSS